MSPIFQCSQVSYSGKKLRGTESNQFHAAGSVYQELNTKLKIKRGELVADLFLKLEEADNVNENQANKILFLNLKLA